MWRSAAAALAFLLGGSLAEAADCANPANPANQAEINQCSGAAADKADGDLNAAYGQLMAVLGTEDQVLLVEAQRNWIAFRDAECAFRTKSYADGSIYSSLISNCIAELSAARAEQLTAQVNCSEGDLCPPHVATASDAAPLETDNTRPCRITAGMKRAQLYASQCTQVTAATHAACNVDNTCGLMIGEIKQACSTIGAAAPAFCATYLGADKASGQGN